MAQYKVPQDVEAEDKFVGPLTFKQFLFAGATLISGYLCFLIITSPVPFFAVLLLPVFLVSLAFTIPWSKDQPTELFLASRIRFLFMKRKRIWDQTGMKDLVTITVPKRVAHVYSDGLSLDEVHSRMSALSSVVDTRGWAVKNAQRPTAITQQEESDRLIEPVHPDVTPEEMDMQRMPDVLDEHSQRSQQMDTMIKQAEDSHRKEALDMIASARAAQAPTGSQTKSRRNKASANLDVDSLIGDYTLPAVDPTHASMKQQTITPNSASISQPTIKPQKVKAAQLSAEDEQKMLDKLHKKQAIEKEVNKHSHMKVIDPSGQSSSSHAPVSTNSDDDEDETVTQTARAAQSNPDILSLARNDDRSVESLAREASKKNHDSNDGEVVISLH